MRSIKIGLLVRMLLFSWLFMVSCPCRAQLNKHSACITVSLDKAYAGDTLLAEFWPSMVDRELSPINNSLPHAVFRKPIDENGRAVFKIDHIKDQGYFYLSKDSSAEEGRPIALINLFLLEAGDSIHIDIQADSFYSRIIFSTHELRRRKYHLAFSGPGSLKFKLSDKWQNLLGTDRYIPPFNSDGTYNDSNYCKTNLDNRLNDLEKLGKRISPRAYYILKADLLGTYLYDISRYGDGFKCNDKIDTTLPQKAEQWPFRKIIDESAGHIPEYAKAFSAGYFEGLYSMERLNYRFSHPRLDWGFYNYLKNQYRDGLRDKMLASFLFEPMENIQHFDSLLRDADMVIQDEYYKKKIKEQGLKLPGTPAYDFNLTDMEGKNVSLHDFKGKVVFLDFYFRGCSGCVIYYKETVRGVEEMFEGNDSVVFIAVCVDGTKASWIKALSSGIYTGKDVKNIVNLYTGGLGYDHPLIKFYNIVEYPCPVVIDRHGKILEFGDRLMNRDELIKVIKTALFE